MEFSKSDSPSAGPDGVGGIGGLVFVLFMVAGNLPAKIVRASVVATFLLMDITTSLMMAHADLLQVKQLYLFAILLLPMGIGIYLGSHIFRKNDSKSFREFTIILLITFVLIRLLLIMFF